MMLNAWEFDRILSEFKFTADSSLMFTTGGELVASCNKKTVALPGASGNIPHPFYVLAARDFAKAIKIAVKGGCEAVELIANDNFNFVFNFVLHGFDAKITTVVDRISSVDLKFGFVQEFHSDFKIEFFASLDDIKGMSKSVKKSPPNFTGLVAAQDCLLTSDGHAAVVCLKRVKLLGTEQKNIIHFASDLLPSLEGCLPKTGEHRVSIGVNNETKKARVQVNGAVFFSAINDVSAKTILDILPLYGENRFEPEIKTADFTKKELLAILKRCPVKQTIYIDDGCLSWGGDDDDKTVIEDARLEGFEQSAFNPSYLKRAINQMPAKTQKIKIEISYRMPAIRFYSDCDARIYVVMGIRLK